MADESPGSVFEATFTDRVVAPIVSAVRRAYDTACEQHDSDRGSNEATFGFSVYHFNVHELCSVADVADSPIIVLSRAPLFRLAIADYELCCHRVGRTANESIWMATPNNEGAACTMIEEQLWLPDVPRHVGLEKARKIVIAHMGNPEDGLGAVYLCIPGRVKGDRIAEWAYARRVWSADEGFAPIVTTSTAVAPDEVVEEPEVRRKPKKDEREEDA